MDGHGGLSLQNYFWICIAQLQGHQLTAKAATRRERTAMMLFCQDNCIISTGLFRITPEKKTHERASRRRRCAHLNLQPEEATVHKSDVPGRCNSYCATLAWPMSCALRFSHLQLRTADRGRTVESTTTHGACRCLAACTSRVSLYHLPGFNGVQPA